MDLNASQNAELLENGGGGKGKTSTDSATCKHAIAVREKLQDDTFAWIMRCLEMIFEFFNEKSSRDKEIEKLSEVTLKFCTMQLEHKRAKDVFETLCHTHPVQFCPRDFDLIKEYDKRMVTEAKVKKSDAQKHPKFVKFLERVNELQRGKQLSQTEAISVE